GAHSTRPPHSFPTRRSSDLTAFVAFHVSLTFATRPQKLHKSTIFEVYCQKLQSETFWPGNQVFSFRFILAMWMASLIHWSVERLDRKSTRLNSSHVSISYAV